jgi:3-hydroxyisobutyrate dehydrogenase
MQAEPGKVAWFGLGAMGLPMALRLAAAGYRVIAFDLSPAARVRARTAGLEVADTAPDTAEIVVTMLPDSAAVGSVLDTIALRNTLAIDCSTIGAPAARAISARLKAAGGAFVDAPVSGGTSAAAAGSLTIMAGGEAADLDRARPVLVPMGNVIHLGPVGSGQTAKVVNNAIVAATLIAVCEGAALAEAAGIDHATFHDLAMRSSADSWALRHWYPGTAAEDFPTALLAKDVHLALEMGAGLSLAAVRLAARRLDELAARSPMTPTSEMAGLAG